MAVRVGEKEFEETVIRSKIPVLVDFYSDSCVACKMLAPVLGNLEDEYEDRLKIVKVNTNFDMSLAERYEVLGNPTLLFFKEGKPEDRKVGAKKMEELKEWVDSLL